jgi:hypothetical protein
MLQAKYHSLVDNGTISRFGAVDDTEGGNTARTNIKCQ